MKPIFLFLILIAFLGIAGCEKKLHENEIRPPLTEEQLQWIRFITPAKYKVITAGKIDTVTANIGGGGVMKHNTVENDEYTVEWYSGSYDIGITSTNTFFYSEVNTNNFSDFSVSFKIDAHDHMLNEAKIDTASINGKLYSDVYKFINLPYEIVNCYYIKKIGFVYFEKSNGDKALLIP